MIPSHFAYCSEGSFAVVVILPTTADGNDVQWVFCQLQKIACLTSSHFETTPTAYVTLTPTELAAPR